MSRPKFYPVCLRGKLTKDYGAPIGELADGRDKIFDNIRNLVVSTSVIVKQKDYAK